MNTAEMLRNLRMSKGLTMDEVASKLGTTKQTIYKYENGIVTNIPLDKLEMLANIYGTTPAALAGWDDQDEKEILLEQLRQSPETRMLFDAAKGATAEQIKQAAEILRLLKGNK